MRWMSWTGAAAIAATLTGCGGGSLGGGQSGSGAVPLATTADALRELGITLTSARLLQLQLPTACTSGSDTVAGPFSKSRSFVYFTSFTGTVVYQTHNYAACANSDGSTYDGLLEAGATADSAYSYVVRGSQSGVLLVRSNSTSSSGTPLSNAQSQLGTIEKHVSGTQTEMRSGLEVRLEQTPQSGGSPTYQGNLSLGVDGPTFDVVSDSSGNGGNGSLTVAGSYTYNSTTCTGGTATAATPSALLLTPSSDGSYSYASGGTLSVSSGTDSVTYTFSASGATLSGSVSGTLSSAQVQQAFSTGSNC